jgi:hypothetical protein
MTAPNEGKNNVFTKAVAQVYQDELQKQRLLLRVFFLFLFSIPPAA